MNINKATISEVYSAVTNDIRVSVSSEPLLANSNPAQHLFSFAYTINIENIGQQTVQLLERHWIIKSDGIQIAEVVGDGVVGEQPTLKPGEAFQYTSGAVVHDPVGSMEGSYTFKSESGRYFEVGIPRFELHFPLLIH